MAAEIKRVRSPNYPQVGLPTAIANAKKVWDKVHKHSAARDIVLSSMGYKGYNGASAGVLSALVKFGLLGREGEDYRVTTLGRDILTLSEGPDRAKAMQEAANKPLLFNQLITHFDGGVPANDDLIRSFLVRKDFSPNTVPQVIQAFRETFELVERESQAYTPDSTLGEEESDAMESASEPEIRRKAEVTPHAFARAASMPEGERELLYGPISRAASYRLFVSGDVGPKELGKLIKLLQLHKEMLSDEDDEDGITDHRKDN